MDENRTRRVSEAVREELSELIGFEMDDPRLSSVSVTSADVSPDMRHAHVKIAVDTAADADRAERAAMAGLEHAKSFLKHELASRLNLRRIPDLHFVVDSHPNAESRIEFLLRRAKRKQARG
jgi:ribosome-binding factor A